jgi:hypothetical protein
VDRDSLSGAVVSLAWFTRRGSRPLPRCSSWMEDTLACGSRSSSRGSAKSRPLGRTTGESRLRGSSLAKAGERRTEKSKVGSGRRGSARMHWPLQPLDPRARDRRCPSRTDRDNVRPTWLLVGHKQWAAPVRREPIWSCSVKARLAWLRKEGHATQVAFVDGRWGLNPEGSIAAR